MVETGNWEGDTLIYRADLPTSGVKAVVRNVTKCLPDGKLTSDTFFGVNGAPEKLAVSVDAVKK